MKRYTTTGMGTDQGKVGNINGLAIPSKAVEKEIADVGVTTFRPPYTPVTFGAMAGRDVGPIMADPLTGRHQWTLGMNAPALHSSW